MLQKRLTSFQEGIGRIYKVEYINCSSFFGTSYVFVWLISPSTKEKYQLEYIVQVAKDEYHNWYIVNHYQASRKISKRELDLLNECLSDQLIV